MCMVIVGLPGGGLRLARRRLLAGEQDFVTLRSMEGWQRLTKRRFVVISGAGYHALLEKPEAYGRCLEAFLQEHEY